MPVTQRSHRIRSPVDPSAGAGSLSRFAPQPVAEPEPAQPDRGRRAQGARGTAATAAAAGCDAQSRFASGVSAASPRHVPGAGPECPHVRRWRRCDRPSRPAPCRSARPRLGPRPMPTSPLSRGTSAASLRRDPVPAPAPRPEERSTGGPDAVSGHRSECAVHAGTPDQPAVAARSHIADRRSTRWNRSRRRWPELLGRPPRQRGPGARGSGHAFSKAWRLAEGQPIVLCRNTVAAPEKLTSRRCLTTAPGIRLNRLEEEMARGGEIGRSTRAPPTCGMAEDRFDASAELASWINEDRRGSDVAVSGSTASDYSDRAGFRCSSSEGAPECFDGPGDRSDKLQRPARAGGQTTPARKSGPARKAHPAAPQQCHRQPRDLA